MLWPQLGQRQVPQPVIANEVGEGLAVPALVVGRFLKPASHCSAYCRTVHDAGRQGVLAERLGDRRCQPRDVMRCPGRPDAMAASSGSTPKTRHNEPRSRTFPRCP